ncbi:hypothetical protein BS47DRAFT_1372921 [Hydnum rufescens UP504]|uniref:tRNA (uracil-O(2)-)-methyltransferase n=1 Tax=Hydnum rufescens UP504 TaxID=1448309 RepID=A0A9P6DR93_9AGAM|nr:hypothetical protein BS47DRAFT_1372921 [Hydnum rufescens UP504]
MHPERNSSLILRAEILSDGAPINVPPSVRDIPGYTAIRNITRRILPRLPQRDRALDQDCTYYTGAGSVPAHDECDGVDEDVSRASLVVLTPRLDDGAQDLPWYHPPVRHLAFRYIQDVGGANLPVIRVEIVPLHPEDSSASGATAPSAVVTDPASRLYRTCLSLLETVWKYGKGMMTGYKKRVVHDTLVPREAFQDLYLIMRERFKDIADVWHEATDASKHVFEDISIATFLILLWKDMYPAPTTPIDPDSKQPWHAWGRPQNGFLDLGCGNGLLVHILRECGYTGLGVDVRARKSWPHYPPKMFPMSARGRFIIGNHADEMQPWVPVLAALTRAEYLSIPCCAWEFDARFQMKKQMNKSDEEGGLSPEEEDLERKLKYDEKDGRLGLYASYVLWLAGLSRKCGFVVESEALRIPSTRNRAIIGRKRIYDNIDGNEAVLARARAMVEEVRIRGVFRARKPEGKAGLEVR